MKHWTLWFFGICVLLTLGVSIPATYDALRLWHGWELGVFALLVFEVGAVGAKLATLAIPEWRGRLTALAVCLLGVTTAANYAHGYDLAKAAQASPTLAAVLADPTGAVLATVLAAALFPVLLFVFLSAFVARCEVVLSGRDVGGRVRAIVARFRARLRAARAEAAAACESLAQVRAELAAAHERIADRNAELAQARAGQQHSERMCAEAWQETAALRETAADQAERLAQYESWLRQAQAEVERERSRPVLTKESALGLLVEIGAVPESTARTWRQRILEGEVVNAE